MAIRTNSSSLARYYVAITICVIGWGLSTTFVEFGLESGTNPYVFLALRFTLAVILSSPFVWYTRKAEIIALFRTRWIYLIGVCETSGLLFQYQGQERNVSAGLASLLTMMFVLIVPFLSHYVLREKFSLNHAIAILFGFIGVLFIITEGDISQLVNSNTSTIGIILLLLSALSYAFYQIVTSKFTREVNTHVDSVALFYGVMIAIMIYSSSAALLTSSFKPNLNLTFDTWVWAGLLAIFSTIIAFITYFEAAKGISANTLSILLISQMLVPFFVDIFILGKQYSIWVYTGGIIIVLGMLFIARIPTVEEKPVLNTEVPVKQL